MWKIVKQNSSTSDFDFENWIWEYIYIYVCISYLARTKDEFGRHRSQEWREQAKGRRRLSFSSNEPQALRRWGEICSRWAILAPHYHSSHRCVLVIVPFPITRNKQIYVYLYIDICVYISIYIGSTPPQN